MRNDQINQYLEYVQSEGTVLNTLGKVVTAPYKIAKGTIAATKKISQYAGEKSAKKLEKKLELERQKKIMKKEAEQKKKINKNKEEPKSKTFEKIKKNAIPIAATVGLGGIAANAAYKKYKEWKAKKQAEREAAKKESE